MGTLSGLAIAFLNQSVDRPLFVPLIDRDSLPSNTDLSKGFVTAKSTENTRRILLN